MRKVYTLIGAALLISGGSIGQNMKQHLPVATPSKVDLEQIARIGNTAPSATPPGDTIFSEDFSGGFPATWSMGNGGNNADWVYTTDPAINCTYTSATMNSTSVTDGYMLLFGDKLNSDAACQNYTGTAGAMDAWIQTPAIDLSAYNSVLLKFQHTFRYCCDGSANGIEVEVSTDATNWTRYNVKGDFPFLFGISGNTVSPSPVHQELNISAVAANQSTVYIRWHKTLNTHYYWAVDDVAVVEGPADDILIVEELSYFSYDEGGFYTQVPRSQAPGIPVSFKGSAFNNGSNAATGVSVQVEVKDGSGSTLFNQTSPTQSMNTLEFDTLTVPSTWMAGATCDDVDTYTITHTVSQTETDQRNHNNSIERTLEVTDTVFARDYDNVSGSFGPGSYNCCGKVDGEEIGSLYEFSADAEARSITTYLSNSTDTTGAITIFANLYRIYIDAGGTIHQTLVGSSDIVDVGGAHVGQLITIPFQTPAQVTADSMYIASIEIHGHVAANFRIGQFTDVNQPNGVSFITEGTPTGWGWIGSHPLIRLNAGNGPFCVGINDIENTHNLQVFPNPNSGVFNIAAENLGDNVTEIRVTNIIGQVVYSRTVKSSSNSLMETVDISDKDKGMYFITIINDDTESVHKVIVE